MVYLNNFMFVITMYFEGLKEDWFCLLGHPRKIKNLLNYLLTYYQEKFTHTYNWINVVSILAPLYLIFDLLNL